MNIDWFYFRIISSSLLLFFLLLSLFFRFYDSFKLKNDLKKIKNGEVSRIVNNTRNFDLTEQYDTQLLDFKKEIDSLMKDVCFDSYDDKPGSHNKTELDFSIDFEESLDKLLDGKILDILKEKDLLLKQKDGLIATLEDKNRGILKALVNKAFFLLLEKDKLIKEKDVIVNSLKKKLQELNAGVNVSYISPYSQPSTTSKDLPNKNPSYDFINVNAIN